MNSKTLCIAALLSACFGAAQALPTDLVLDGECIAFHQIAPGAGGSITAQMDISACGSGPTVLPTLGVGPSHTRGLPKYAALASAYFPLLFTLREDGTWFVQIPGSGMVAGGTWTAGTGGGCDAACAKTRQLF